MSHPDPTAEQIAAELADHLATSAGELERRGTPAAEASKQAQEQFGDVEAVSRQCYWVQQGDTIMFRRVTIALVVLLCLGLIATTANSWLAQSRMSQQLDKLNEQLASLTKTQESLQDQQKPLSITGLIYDGDKSKPVANAEVGISRLSDCEVVRRVKTDSRGKYVSGPVPEGDYFVFGTPTQKVLTSRGAVQFVQGPPVYLYARAATAAIDLNVGYVARGRITLDCSPPLKAIEIDKRSRLVPSLMVTAFSSRWRIHPWNPSSPQPEQWPLYVALMQKEAENVNRGGEGEPFVRPLLEEILTSDEIATLDGTLFRNPSCDFPEGTLYIGGLLMIDIASPSDFSTAGASDPQAGTDEIQQVVSRHREYRRRLERPLANDWLKEWFWSHADANEKTRGVINLSLASQWTPLRYGQRIRMEKFAIAPGEELHLRVELPSDWDSDIRTVLEKAKTVDELQIGLAEGDKLFRQVKFSHIGTQ